MRRRRGLNGEKEDNPLRRKNDRWRKLMVGYFPSHYFILHSLYLPPLSLTTCPQFLLAVLSLAQYACFNIVITIFFSHCSRLPTVIYIQYFYNCPQFLMLLSLSLILFTSKDNIFFPLLPHSRHSVFSFHLTIFSLNLGF